ncbi:MAG: LysR family transcriptional regulator [Rhodospirillaceae bacterium]|jgi:DNA-binding transcriptional LysR family regulator|nr:LysR family transcriptional regulator [Rhodospirillaceae bacterium]
MSLRLRHIEVFHAIMATGSASKAADQLHTSQPTVSRVLAEMEREIGFPLFVRDGRALAPTPESRDLYQEVQHNFTCLDSIGSMAARIAAHEHGNIRITAAPSISISILPLAIQRFLGRHPGVGVTLEVRTPQAVIESIENRDFDIGITALTNSSDTLIAQPLVQIEAVCIMPDDHPLAAKEIVTPADLASFPSVALGRNSMSRQRTDSVFDRMGEHRTIVAETQTGSVACALVSQRIGLAVLDFLTVDVVAKPPLTFRPFRPCVPIDFVLVSSKVRPNARATGRFIEVLDEIITEIDSPFVVNHRARRDAPVSD